MNRRLMASGSRSAMIGRPPPWRPRATRGQQLVGGAEAVGQRRRIARVEPPRDRVDGDVIEGGKVRDHHRQSNVSAARAF